MLYEYKTVKQEISAETIERRSKFISHIKPVKTEQEALDFLNSIKSKYWDATHNVYAYVIKDNNIQRYSDDGEPSGTSGVPTLEVIKKEGLTDTCVVTTRYFGGILLGAGGLVRAYTAAAKAGIDASGIVTRKLCYEYEVSADYAIMGKLKSKIIELGGIVNDIEYSDIMKIKCMVPYDINGFSENLVDASNGRAEIVKKEDGIFIDID